MCILLVQRRRPDNDHDQRGEKGLNGDRLEEGRANDGEEEGQGQGVEEVEVEKEAENVNVAAWHLRVAGGRDIVGFSGCAGVDAGRRWALDVGAAHLLQFLGLHVHVHVCAGAVLAAQEYPIQRKMIPKNRACWGFEIFVRSSKLYLLALGRVSGKVEGIW